jgi:hypothetical protein
MLALAYFTKPECYRARSQVCHHLNGGDRKGNRIPKRAFVVVLRLPNRRKPERYYSERRKECTVLID